MDESYYDMSLSLQDDNISCNSSFDSYEFTKVAIVNLVTGCVSFVVCCLVICIIILIKNWKFFSQRLVLYLTITALLFSLASILNRVDFSSSSSNTSAFLSGFCVFGGLLTQLTSWMMLCSMMGITFYLFVRTVFNRNTEKYEWAYISFIFLLPLLFNWIPFVKSSYGDSGAWCWIRSYDLVACEVLDFGLWLQFALLYIPLYLVISVLLILYAIIIITIYRKKKQVASTYNSQHSTPDKVFKKIMNEVFSLVLYPLISIFLNFPLLLNRIYSALNPTAPSVFLWYMASVALPLQGALTGCVFAFTTILRRRHTWTSLRASTLKKNKRKVLEYPMKTSQMSDSMGLSTTPNSNTISDYTMYRL